MSSMAIMGGLAAVGTVLQGVASYQENKYQAKVADANADIMRANADQKRLETSINEDVIREQNRRTLARNIAASSEQGMANSATTIGALGQQATDLEQNALNLRYEGIAAAENMDIQANYYNQMAKGYKRQGNNAFYMSLIKAPIAYASAYTSAGGDIGSYFSSTSRNTKLSPESYLIGGNRYVAYSK